MCTLFDICGVCEWIQKIVCFVVLLPIFGWIGKGIVLFYGQNVNIAYEIAQPGFWTPDGYFWIMGFSLIAILFGFCFGLKMLCKCFYKIMTILCCTATTDKRDDDNDLLP